MNYHQDATRREAKELGDVVGIDVGIKTLAACSDGGELTPMEPGDVDDRASAPKKHPGVEVGKSSWEYYPGSSLPVGRRVVTFGRRVLERYPVGRFNNL